MSPRSTSSSPVLAQQRQLSDPLAASPRSVHDDALLETEHLLPLATSTSVSYSDSDSSESVSIDPSEPEASVAHPSHHIHQSPHSVLQPASIGFCLEAPESRDGLDHQSTQQPTPNHSLRKRLKRMMLHEPLLTATILGVLLGILSGSLIRLSRPSSKATDLIGI